MNSIDFVRSRAQATRNAQASLAAPPTSWSWEQKTVMQWDTDITTLDQLIMDESAKHTQWRNAAEQWQADLDRIQDITRQAAGFGRTRFRNDPVKQQLFLNLSTDARNRLEVFAQGLSARDVWQEIDPAWAISAEVTVSALGSLLSSSLARQAAESVKLTAWRRAASALANKARLIDADNVAWYADATRRFPEATTEGDMIRSSVPTTTRPESAVEQAVISHLLVSGGQIHFDVSAPGATRYTYLQQSPGAAAFVVVQADVPESSLTLPGQPAGLHRFKAFGSNSSSNGPESAILEVTVSAAAAA